MWEPTGEWQIRRGGLIIPADVQVQTDETSSLPSGSVPSRVAESRKRSRWLDHLQTWATVLAVVLSVPAFWLVLTTFRQQVSLSQRAEEQYRRRYADRVTLWDEPLSGNVRAFHIDNNSTVIMTHVVLMTDELDHPIVLSFFFSDIPPCSSVTASIDLQRIASETDTKLAWEMPAEHGGPGDLILGRADRNLSADLHFTDFSQYWALTNFGLYGDNIALWRNPRAASNYTKPKSEEDVVGSLSRVPQDVDYEFYLDSAVVRGASRGCGSD
jgi:hypothetical protein